MELNWHTFNIWNFVSILGAIVAAGFFLFSSVRKEIAAGYKELAEQRQVEIADQQSKMTKLETDFAQIQKEHIECQKLNHGLQVQLDAEKDRSKGLEMRVSILEATRGVSNLQASAIEAALKHTGE